MSQNTPTPGNPRISPTAYATASAWARFGFPESARFATRRGRAMLLALDLASALARPRPAALAGGTQILYWRHRAFNAWLDNQTPAVAIEIGAGLSARGLVHARAHPAMQWLDYDLAAMVAARRRYLADRVLPPNYHLRVGDLLDTRLARYPLRPPTGPAVALTEGVIEYLAPADKLRAWRHIARLLSGLGGGRYLCEIYPLSGIVTSSPARALVRRLAPTLSPDPETACRGLCRAGFAQARVLETVGPKDGHDPAGPGPLPFCLLEAEI